MLPRQTETVVIGKVRACLVHEHERLGPACQCLDPRPPPTCPTASWGSRKIARALRTKAAVGNRQPDSHGTGISRTSAKLRQHRVERVG